MNQITKEYLLLFNALTDAEESLQLLRNKLMAVQQQAEDLFLSDPLPIEERSSR